MRLLLLFLLILSAGFTWQTLRVTPAFNPAMLEETVVGNGMLVVREAMYDPATYDFQRGFGFLMGDLAISAETENREETASFETSFDRAVRAQGALEDALHRDPANAHAWAALGWSHIRQGDTDLAIVALQNSWNLAPHNRALADNRINLVSVLAEFDADERAVIEPYKNAILRDARVMSEHDASTFEFYMQTGRRLSQYITEWKQN